MRHVLIYIFMSSNNIVSIAACVCVCMCVWPTQLNSLSLVFNGQTQILHLSSPGPRWRLAKL